MEKIIMTSPKDTYQALMKLIDPARFHASFDEPLSRHSTWRIGGPADLLIEPHDAESIAAICRYADARKLPLIVIGKGSNLLFDDAGFRGIVLKLGKYFSQIVFDGNRITADAGASVPKLAAMAARHSLTGLEHTCGIPGTLGGLVFMNGGSQNKAIGDCVEWVEMMTGNFGLQRLSKDECEFSYRTSVFQKNFCLLITRIGLFLETGLSQDIRNAMKEIHEKRKTGFPLNLPNCGSVFKIDPALLETFGPPGKIIDTMGLKGFRKGDAEVSEKHANFIVNRGTATSGDVIRLIEEIRIRVQATTGRFLKCEVLYAPPDGNIIPLHKLFHDEG